MAVKNKQEKTRRKAGSQLLGFETCRASKAATLYK
jgi:hypothetical protein